MLAALAAGQVPESVGRLICVWTDKLPDKARDEADEALVAAAAGGLGLEELAALFAEMYERARSERPDEDPDRDFADRGVKLATTFGGAGLLYGDLTRECAEVVGRVLDALGGKAGKDDDRSKQERYHDALHEAMRRLVSANLVPERAGQPVKAWVHIALADLLLLDADSALQEQWTVQVRARWAAHRARAAETGANDGAWLDGDAAEAIACDAAMAPIVTGDVNVGALEDLVRLCAELDRLRRDGDGPGAPATDTTTAWAALEQAVIGKAVDLLSGPGGLASFLRRRQLGARLGGPSLPLDIGYAETIPAGIRNAVTLRDRHCQWAGGCTQPASACEVHHTRHKARGGKTSATDCVLALPLPPPGRHPPLGLDACREPGRDDERVEQGQDQDPAQPRATRPRRITTPARPRDDRLHQHADHRARISGRRVSALAGANQRARMSRRRWWPPRPPGARPGPRRRWWCAGAAAGRAIP